MFIELFATDNFYSYNVSLAKSIGIENAVYFSVLLNIGRKSNDEWFEVSRDDIYDKTGMDEKSQLKSDKKLISFNLINKDEETHGINGYCLNIDIIISMFNTDGKDLNPIKPTKSKKTKSAIITEKLKARVVEDDAEIRNLYYDWIEVMIEKKGFLSVKNLQDAKSTIDEYARGNNEIKKGLLRIAIERGYLAMRWTIPYYEKDNTFRRVETDRPWVGNEIYTDEVIF